MLSDRDAPERRCIVTGAHGGREQLLRFVLGPDGEVVPDLKALLPGRGMWVTPDRNALRKAIEKRLFARAAKAAVRVPDGLEAQVERLLVKSVQGRLGLAFKAGEVTLGFAKVEAGLERGRIVGLVQASDAGPHGVEKLTRKARHLGLPVIDVLAGAEMGLALGRENMVHAGLNEGRLARRFLEDAQRLQQFRKGEGSFAGEDTPHSDVPDEDVAAPFNEE